mmetsp:Transcript_11794/g.18103  ORF Transcript_11794/g.18103 Transcript_11794/m.18103 type:complete len:106 (+) Transcript_11794:14-331(+)
MNTSTFKHDKDTGFKTDRLQGGETLRQSTAANSSQLRNLSLQPANSQFTQGFIGQRRATGIGVNAGNQNQIVEQPASENRPSFDGHLASKKKPIVNLFANRFKND